MTAAAAAISSLWVLCCPAGSQKPLVGTAEDDEEQQDEQAQQGSTSGGGSVSGSGQAGGEDDDDIMADDDPDATNARTQRLLRGGCQHAVCSCLAGLVLSCACACACYACAVRALTVCQHVSRASVHHSCCLWPSCLADHAWQVMTWPATGQLCGCTLPAKKQQLGSAH